MEENPIQPAPGPVETTSETVVQNHSTGIGTPDQAIGELAKVVASTGPDPIMLATVVVFCGIMLMMVIYLIRRFQAQQESVIQHQQERSSADQTFFREQLNKQRDEFRVELGSQRDSHLGELTRTADLFERSLEKIVVTNKEGMDAMSTRLTHLDGRMECIEDALISKGLVKPKRTPKAKVKKTVEIEIPQEEPT